MNTGKTDRGGEWISGWDLPVSPPPSDPGHSAPDAHSAPMADFAQLSGLNDVLPTRIIDIDPREIQLLELNARYMRHETYKTLVANIRRDGKLTSVPFCWLDPTTNRWEVLSGNHRVKASIDAGLQTITVMVTDAPLSRQQRVALQLSHNAIAGEDDPATLRQLYEELADVDWRQYAGLDDKTLGLMQQVELPSLSEAHLQGQTLSLLFLPPEIERLKAVFEALRATVTGSAVTWAVSLREYDRLLEGLDAAAGSYGISNQATALLLLLEIAERHMGDLKEGYLPSVGDHALHKHDVALASVFGNPKVPAATAVALHRVIDQMVTAGEVPDDRRWEALDLLVGRWKETL